MHTRSLLSSKLNVSLVSDQYQSDHFLESEDIFAKKLGKNEGKISKISKFSIN